MIIAYQDKVCEQVRSFLLQQGLDFTESEEPYARRFDIHAGRDTCVTKVSSKGAIYNQVSPNSRLKEVMEKFKAAIEHDQAPLAPLPFDIESFPDKLQANIPAIDPVIIHFVREAVVCLKANALTACAFLIGAASEKATLLLIDSYARAIAGEPNQTGFRNRVSNRFISKAYEEFKRSFSSCKSRPTDPAIAQDLEVKIETIFHFCRICRNDVGHPDIVPNLDKGILLANMAQFMSYIETIYRLIDYFNNNPVTV